MFRASAKEGSRRGALREMHLASAFGPSYKHVVHVHLATPWRFFCPGGMVATAKLEPAPVPPWTSPESPASSEHQQRISGMPVALPVKEVTTHSTRKTTEILQFRELRQQAKVRPLQLLPRHSIRFCKPLKQTTQVITAVCCTPAADGRRINAQS